MGAYLIRRLLLVIPTLWAIITINFFIVQIGCTSMSRKYFVVSFQLSQTL